MEPNAQPLVEVRGITKHFSIPPDKTLVAVNNLSLVVGQGETVGLVGESGSGKTTLGRLILRLVDPTFGEILYRGHRISDLPERLFRRMRPKLQMVFQDPASSLNPRMTVRQALEDAASVLKVSSGERNRRVDEVLEAVSFPTHLRDAHPEALTGSQQQRCAVARTLIMRPDLIVLDEPVSNLDVMGRFEIIELLRDLQSRFGMSYLFISHDLTAVRKLGHRIVVMYLGRIVEEAPTEELFARPIHPYTRSLLSAVLSPNPHEKLPPYELKGEIPSPIDLPIGCPLYSRCPIAQLECTRWEPELLALDSEPHAPKSSSHRVACRRLREVVAVAASGRPSAL
jgi:peptide/nickel transport system ATP-binding protein